MAPAILAGLASVNLGCVCFGLYLREYLGNAAYDWEYVSGKRPRRWTTWIYLACRTSTLVAMALVFVALDIRYHIDCEAIYVITSIACWVAYQLATVIIVLRIMVVWGRRTDTSLLAWATWLTAIPFFVRYMVTTRSVWIPEASACVPAFTSRERDLEIVTLCSDVAMVLLMLAGLMRKHRGGLLDVWGVLFRQALIWLGLTVLAEVPTVVLMSTPRIHDNNLKVVFWVPRILIISIGATRMYRTLAEFIDLWPGYRTFATSSTTSYIGPSPQELVRGDQVRPMEITVHTEFAQFEEEPDVVTEEAIRKAMIKDGAWRLTRRDLEFL